MKPGPAISTFSTSAASAGALDLDARREIGRQHTIGLQARDGPGEKGLESGFHGESVRARG